MPAADFDEPIDRLGTLCSKWDDMHKIFGVAPQDGIAMWVADMDFAAPPAVRRALEATVAHGIYGYPGVNQPYLDAIRWWMQTRHGWQVERDHILSVHGLVNGTALAVDAFTQPGDAVVLMTPVYHAFARVIKAAGRTVTTSVPCASPSTAPRSATRSAPAPWTSSTAPSTTPA